MTLHTDESDENYVNIYILLASYPHPNTITNQYLQDIYNITTNIYIQLLYMY